MYHIKRILVCLDGSEIDDALLNYTSALYDKTSVEQIYFLHIVKKLEIPKEISKKYPDLLAPIDETIKKNFLYGIQQFENLKADNFSLDVLEGNVTETILKYAHVKNVDLIVIGKKSGLAGSGVVDRRVTRIAHCSVALIPESLPEKLQRIVVPVDYSETSMMSLQQAIYIARKNEFPEIMCVHTYSVPSGYHTTGKSFDQFAEIMKENARREYETYTESLDTKGVKITCHYVLDEHNNPAEKIYQFAVKQKANLIVLGSKGRTAMASIILGSVSEKVINYNKHLPMMVVKDKARNMDFVDALLKV